MSEDFGIAGTAPMPGEEKLRLEKELLGLYLSDHPLNRVAEEMARLTDARAIEVTTDLEGQEVRLGGLVRELRRVVTKKGQIMAYGTIEDLTGSVDVILFPQKYELYRRLFESDQPLVIQGKVDARSSGNRNGGGSAAPAPAIDDGEPAAEVEEAAELASVVVDFAWAWNDPDCVAVERRHVLHIEIPVEDAEIVDSLTAVLARHPGEDDVYLHFRVDGREVVVQAGDRYHVTAGPALAGEVQGILGEGTTRLVPVRPRASGATPRRTSNGNGHNGRGRSNGA